MFADYYHLNPTCIYALQLATLNTDDAAKARQSRLVTCGAYTGAGDAFARASIDCIVAVSFYVHFAYMCLLLPVLLLILSSIGYFTGGGSWPSDRRRGRPTWRHARLLVVHELDEVRHRARVAHGHLRLRDAARVRDRE